MKTKRFVVLLALVAGLSAVLLLPGCVRFDGVVDFEADVLVGNRPLLVQFTPLVQGCIDKCIWNFGDGTFSTERNPVHTYEQAGSYTVILTVIPSRGEPASARKDDYIRVISGPLFGAAPRVQDCTSLISGDVPVLLNRTYVVGYGEDRLNPLWVGYRVYSVSQVGPTPSHGWRIDTRTTARVSNNDYKHTEGDIERGHMAPKSAIYHCYGADAVYDTFQMSNACPQLSAFNNGIWKVLETLVRDVYSNSFDEVWIITGPIFDDSNGQEYLTKDNEHSALSQKPVEIPDAFYKIIIDVLDGEIRTLALVLEHREQSTNQNQSSSERLLSSLRSIDDIEEATGLDFLWELDLAFQVDLESQPAPSMW